MVGHGQWKAWKVIHCFGHADLAEWTGDVVTVAPLPYCSFQIQAHIRSEKDPISFQGT